MDQTRQQREQMNWTETDDDEADQGYFDDIQV